MSDTVSKEQRRNLRRAIGETAAAAMAECKTALQSSNARQAAIVENLLVLEKRSKAQGERLEAALKLGFANETAIGEERTHRLKLAAEQRDYVDRGTRDLWEAVRKFQEFRRRRFLGRLKWLVLGR